jgi:DNA modification methylase
VFRPVKETISEQVLLVNCGILPFCGSGSTLLAAAQLKRVGYACEVDPGYVAVGLERLALLGLKPELRN